MNEMSRYWLGWRLGTCTTPSISLSRCSLTVNCAFTRLGDNLIYIPFRLASNAYISFLPVTQYDDRNRVYTVFPLSSLFYGIPRHCCCVMFFWKSEIIQILFESNKHHDITGKPFDFTNWLYVWFPLVIHFVIRTQCLAPVEDVIALSDHGMP